MTGGVSTEKKRRKSGEFKRGWGYFRWGSKSAISSCQDVPRWLGTRMDIRFYELHATVNCATSFTYKYFSAYPGCVIGGGLARLATCFKETVVCNSGGVLKKCGVICAC